MIRNNAIAPNTAPNEIVKSPILMPNETLLIASSRSPAATSQRPIASAITISTNSARTMPEANLAEQAEPARIDPELARELSSARGIRRQRALDRRVGDDEQQIERRDQRDREHDAARGKRREARIPGEQRAHDAGDHDPGEQAHAGDTAARLRPRRSRSRTSRCTSSARDRDGEQHARSRSSIACGSADRAMQRAQHDEGAEQPPAPDQVRGQPLRAAYRRTSTSRRGADRPAPARWSPPRARAPRWRRRRRGPRSAARSRRESARTGRAVPERRTPRSAPSARGAGTPRARRAPCRSGHRSAQ